MVHMNQSQRAKCTNAGSVQVDHGWCPVVGARHAVPLPPSFGGQAGRRITTEQPMTLASIIRFKSGQGLSLTILSPREIPTRKLSATTR